MLKNKWFLVVAISILVIGLSACVNTVDKKDPSEGKSTHQENNPNESDQQTTDENTNNSEEEMNNNSEGDTNNETDEQISEIIEVNKDQSITALVNKHHSLDENYVPEDLVTVSVPTVLENPEVNQLRKIAADALRDMFDQAKRSEVYLHARSGYRSYQTQVQLFNNYAEQHGEEAANRYSARPGHSEHQTGLVMDVTSESVNFQLDEQFGESEEGTWLSQHAHEFGFVIRYPQNMEDMTGYIYEPWHIRYLGVDVATEVYESGLTYEEYLDREGIIHEVNSEK